MLEWRDAPFETGEEHAFSPLLMVPVELDHDSSATRFTISRSDEEVVLNPALSAKLLSDFKISLELTEDVDEQDFETVTAFVRERTQSQSGWKVISRTVLSLFSFHKEAIYKDLLQNTDRVASNPLVRTMILGTDQPDSFLFDPVAEEGTRQRREA